MADNVEAQLKQLDVEMKKAKTQTEKDAIKERQAELKRQLEGSKKKQWSSFVSGRKPHPEIRLVRQRNNNLEIIPADPNEIQKSFDILSYLPNPSH